MARMLNTNPDLLRFADYDEEYAAWLQRIADLCERFVNVLLTDLLDSLADVPPWEMFVQGESPERYFVETVLNILENDFGVDYLDEIVHDNVMWGN